MGLFKSSSSSLGAGSQTRWSSAGGQSIRGKISGPISVANSLDDSHPFRGPGAAVTSPVALAPPAPTSSGAAFAAPAVPVEDTVVDVRDYYYHHHQQPPLESSPPPQPLQPHLHHVPYSAPNQARQQSPNQLSVSPQSYPTPTPKLFIRTTPDGDPSIRSPTTANRTSSYASSPQRTLAGSAETAHSTDPVRFSGVSFVSQNSSRRDRPGGRDVPARKKSTLRTTIGRLFGRGRRRDDGGGGGSRDLAIDVPIASIQEEEDGMAIPSPARHTMSAHQQQPPGPAYPAGPNVGSHKRFTSLPSNPDFGRALRSHSIGPDDMSAIVGTRDSFRTDSSFSRSRAATAAARASAAASATFDANANASAYYRSRDTADFDNLSPPPPARPQMRSGSAADCVGENDDGATAARHANDLGDLAADNQFSVDPADPGEIGMAITSESRQTVNQHKRRSRSLSGLLDSDADYAELRRRSEEIRYWRDSQHVDSPAPAPPSGPNADQSTGLEPAGPAPGGDDVFEAFSEPSSSTLPQPVEPARSRTDLADETNNHHHHHSARLSLVSNLSVIEARVRHIEHALSPDPSRHSVDSTISDLSKPDSLPASFCSVFAATAAHDSNPGSSHPARGRMSFGDSLAVAGRLHPPPIMVVTRAARPVSTATLRAVTSLPVLLPPSQPQSQPQPQPQPCAPAAVPLPADGVLTTEHYLALLTLINAERAERQELVLKFRKLERRVALLARHHSVSPAAHRPSSFFLDATLVEKPAGERSFFDDDDAEYSARDAAGSDSDSDADDDDRAADDTSSYSDTFLTPREEYLVSPSLGIGAFGEDLRETHGDGKKAARTLSLSQLAC